MHSEKTGIKYIKIQVAFWVIFIFSLCFYECSNSTSMYDNHKNIKKKYSGGGASRRAPVSSQDFSLVSERVLSPSPQRPATQPRAFSLGLGVASFGDPPATPFSWHKVLVALIWLQMVGEPVPSSPSFPGMRPFKHPWAWASSFLCMSLRKIYP